MIDLRDRLETLITKGSKKGAVFMYSELIDLAIEAVEENEQLRKELDMYRNGYQGACMACEPVGEENQSLRAALEESKAEIDKLTVRLDLSQAARQVFYNMLKARDAEVDRLNESLRECMIDLDNYIDIEYPPDAHPLYANKNKRAKADNPARLALFQREKNE